LTHEPSFVTVQVKHNNSEETFSGSPEQVWLLLDRFFHQFLPSFETARILSLHVDLQMLTHDCENVIGLADEGPYILVSRNKLTDNETLALLLLANYIGHRMGKIQSEGLSKEELQLRLGKGAKITSTRLGELVKNEIAVRTADEKYKITTFGLVQMQKDILPKIKSKAGM
jgi:hypothetical protein